MYEAYSVLLIFAAIEEAETPKLAVVIAYSYTDSSGCARRTKRWRSGSASVSCTARYILETSAVRATRYIRNWSKTSISGGCTVGPTRKVSLRETPQEDFAGASMTALTFVVELDSLRTAWIKDFVCGLVTIDHVPEQARYAPYRSTLGRLC